MAKKTVATLQTGAGKNYTKVIKMVKNSKNNAYSLKQEIVHNEDVKAWFGK